MLISTQGGDYTQAVHARLRASGWQGYWIDAASTLRMETSSVIVLDPVNLPVMQAAREQGIKDFIGGNCTVSLMLMAVCGLLRGGRGRLDHRDDVSIRFGGGRAEHARAPRANGRPASFGGGAARAIRPPEFWKSIVPSAGAFGSARLSDGAFRRAAGGEPDPVDRQGFGQWSEPGGMEGRRRVEQDHGYRGCARAGRGDLRAGERDALPLASPHHQAQTRHSAARSRAADRRRQLLGESRAQ